MKNFNSFFRLGVCAIFVFTQISCSSEEAAATSSSNAPLAESAKTPEIIAFQNQMIKEIKKMNRSADSGGNAARSIEPSSELISSAKIMLAANGVSISELEGKQSENTDAAIISKALRVLADKTTIKTNTQN